MARFSSALLVSLLLIACEASEPRQPPGVNTGDAPPVCPETACRAGGHRCGPDRSVQVCSDFDGDGCSEWGGDVVCPPGSECQEGACVALCQHACAEGERVCTGDAVQTCGDADSDGCRDLSPPVACNDDERCDGGRCVPEAQGCADACEEDGHNECIEGGYRSCGQFDEDDCLDLSVTIPCAPGQVCREGECVADCADECDPGQVVCRAEAFVTCGNFDRDACLEFGPPTACRADERCDNGRCVAAELPCEDDCDRAGGRQCAADGSGYTLCGQYDADACLEPSSLVECGADSRCESGECRPLCEDSCEPGGVRCEGDAAVAVCGNFDRDPCLEWGPEAPCDADERCDDGRCVEAEQPCEDGCPGQDVVRCDGDGLQVCSNSDGDPCLEWSPVVPCAEGERCEAASCVPDCEDACVGGEVTCSGEGTRACGDFDGDGCLELGEVVPCPEGQSCSGGSCRIDCVNDCGAEAERGCTQAGDAYRVCGAYDPDACLDWSSPHPCADNERCEEGLCVPVCEDGCALEDRRCVGAAYEVCGDFDDDPCREFGGGEQCEAGQECLEGFCEVPCDDECAPDERRCADDTSAEECGSFDEDRCREWSAPSPCAAHEACNAGLCQARPVPQGVLVNEVYYNAPGDDAPHVFIELYGPAGTELTGLTLVGLNGSGGGEYDRLALVGVIPPDGFFVIAHTLASDALQPVTDLLADFADLQNGPDSVQLRWGDAVVDAHGYGDDEEAVFNGEGSPADNVEPGLSLTRDAEHTDTDDNAADFSPSDTPTPGAGAPCPPGCEQEGGARCADDVVERCQRDGDGCLAWQAADVCPDEGGRCQDGSCVYPEGCALPVGVGPLVPLAGMESNTSSIEVLPMDGGFAVTSGDPDGVHFALVDLEGSVTAGPHYLGNGKHNPWGGGDAYFPSLVRTAGQYAVVWSGFADVGNRDIYMRRLGLDGQLVPAANFVISGGTKGFNPVVVARPDSPLDLLVVFNQYWQASTIRVDSLGQPDAVRGLTQRYGDSREAGYVALAPASFGHAMAFVLNTEDYRTTTARVYFKRVRADGTADAADVLVASGAYPSRAIRSVWIHRISEEPERFGLVWAAREAAPDPNNTQTLHYAVLDPQGAVQSRVRLNDLERPDLYLPHLRFADHVYLDGDRFGVVHRRDYPELEPTHHSIQWLGFDGESQQRTELGEHRGVLARHPDDGLYRLFVMGDPISVAVLECP